MKSAVSPSAFECPRKIDLTFKIIGVFSIVFFFAVVGLNWFFGDARHWKDGNIKDGDLVQHYAAGILWKEKNISALYQNYQLGYWINDWRKDLKLGNPLQHFNYVYSPIIAWLSSLSIGLPFAVWLKEWFIFSTLLYAIALWLIFRFLISQKNKILLPVLLATIGFPSFYYALIPLQNTTLTLCILCAAAILANRKKEYLAGLALSCAFYKPQFMPYLAFFIFIAGNWKIPLGIVIGSATWLGIGIFICGIEANRLWMQSLLQMIHGKQFILQGLNQSWTGFFSSLFTYASRQEISFASHLLSLILALAAGNLIRFAPKKIEWKPSYTIFAAFTYYLLASTYVGHYEILLGLPWWLIFICHGKWTSQKLILTALFWCISLFSITGLVTGISLTAPFLMLWLFGSLSEMIDWQEVRLFLKYPIWRSKY